MIVYLAGPINGCTDDEANNWRDVAKEALGAENTLDPMRRDYRGIEDQSVDAIVQGDLDDINASDVMLANCWQVSWGTAMEIFYAYSIGKKVRAVLPPGARVSPWLRYHASIYFSLDEALNSILEGELVAWLKTPAHKCQTCGAPATLRFIWATAADPFDSDTFSCDEHPWTGAYPVRVPVHVGEGRAMSPEDV